MAFPVATLSSATSDAELTTHSIAVPAVAAGDRVIVVAITDQDKTFTWPGSPAWTVLLAYASAGSTNISGEIRYRDIDGTEGWGSGGSFDLVTSALERMQAIVVKLDDGSFDAGSPPEASAWDTQTSDVTPDPPLLAPSWGAEHTLWIAIGATDNGSKTLTSYPTDYTVDQITSASTNVNAVKIAVATRELNASSEDPGVFTYDGSNDGTMAATLAVRPAGAAFDPADGFPWQEQPQDWRPQRWHQPDTAPTLGPIPNLTVAPVPAQAAMWPEQRQEPPTLQRWHAPDEAHAPPVLLAVYPMPASLTGDLWRDQSHQQARSAAQRWFHPDDDFLPPHQVVAPPFDPSEGLAASLPEQPVAWTDQHWFRPDDPNEPIPAILRTQSRSIRVGSNAVPVTVAVLPFAAPALGSLIVTAISIDKSSGAITAPAGFTPIRDYVSSSVSGAYAYKVSDGTETSLQWAWATAQMATAWVGVWTPYGAPWTTGVIVLDDASEADSFGFATMSQTTGFTGATVGAPELAIAVAAGDTGDRIETSRAWSNGFGEVAFPAITGESGEPGLSVADKLLVEIAGVETTFSVVDTGDQMWASVATFRVSSNITTATVPQQAALWSTYPEHERWLAARWFAPDLFVEGRIPPAIVVFDPATLPLAEQPGQERPNAAPWVITADLLGVRETAEEPGFAIEQAIGAWMEQTGQERPNRPWSWRHPEMEWHPTATGSPAPPDVYATAKGAGLWPEQPAQGPYKPRWFVPDDGWYPTATGDGPVPPPTSPVLLGGLWIEQPGQERELRPRWFHPDVSTEAVYPTLPAPPAPPAGGGLPVVEYVVEILDSGSTFGPNTKLGELWDLRNLGWSAYDRIPGKAFFTLSQRSDMLSLITPLTTHIRIWRLTPTLTTLVWVGAIIDYDATGDDVVFSAFDYKALLSISRSGYRTLYPLKALGSEIVSPEWALAKGDTSSPLGFVATGTIEDPLAADEVTVIKTNNQFGLLDQMRLQLFFDLSEIGRANTIHHTTFDITRSVTPTFEFRKNKGVNVDLGLVLSGNVSDYRHLPNWTSYRNDLATIGAAVSGGAAELVVKDDIAAAARGRRQDVFTIKTLLGVASAATTVAQQQVASERVLKSALTLQPTLQLKMIRGGIDFFNGWDLCDMPLVEIENGVDAITERWRILGARATVDDGGEAPSLIVAPVAT